MRKRRSVALAVLVMVTLLVGIAELVLASYQTIDYYMTFYSDGSSSCYAIYSYYSDSGAYQGYMRGPCGPDNQTP